MDAQLAAAVDALTRDLTWTLYVHMQPAYAAACAAFSLALDAVERAPTLFRKIDNNRSRTPNGNYAIRGCVFAFV